MYGSCDVCLLISVACIDTDLVIVCSCMLLVRCGCRKLLLGDDWFWLRVLGGYTLVLVCYIG